MNRQAMRLETAALLFNVGFEERGLQIAAEICLTLEGVKYGKAFKAAEAAAPSHARATRKGIIESE